MSSSVLDGRLARAVGPDQTENLALLDRKGNIMCRDSIRVRLGNVVNLDCGHKVNDSFKYDRGS